MDEKQALTGQQILDADLADWRFNLKRLVARFETGDFNAGAALVSRIAEAADEVNHHPDVDLRYPHLSVTLSSHDVNAVTSRDVDLARRISELAAEAGVAASATAPDILELALDSPDNESGEALLGGAPGLSPDPGLRRRPQRPGGSGSLAVVPAHGVRRT